MHMPANVNNLWWYRGVWRPAAKKLRVGQKNRGKLQFQLDTSSLMTDPEAARESQFSFTHLGAFGVLDLR